MGDIRVGWIHQKHLIALSKFKNIFSYSSDDGLQLRTQYKTFDERTSIIQEVVQRLREQGLVSDWHSEMYAVLQPQAEPDHSQALFAIERSVTPFFGIVRRGVHLNAYYKQNDQYYVWIAKRSMKLAYAPGKLDNTVGGGVPIDVTITEQLVREAYEEASISRGIAQQAIKAQEISYCFESHDSLIRDIIFVFDLELPTNFIVSPHDEEISEYIIMEASELLTCVDNTDQFKINSALVVIDFLIRHGIIKNTVRDYRAIKNGLRNSICYK